MYGKLTYNGGKNDLFELHMQLDPKLIVSHGIMPICSNAYGRWFVLRVRHSVRMTYRSSAALWLLGSLRISHKKFHV